MKNQGGKDENDNRLDNAWELKTSPKIQSNLLFVKSLSFSLAII
jgi:hypothetical protein